VKWLLVLLLPAYRYLDIVRWWLSALLNPRHRTFMSFSRNLLFLALNLAELSLVTAILLVSTQPLAARWDSWLDAGFLTLQLSLPERGSTLHSIAQLMGAGGSLLLLVAALAVVITGIAEKFVEGRWTGPAGALEKADKRTLPDSKRRHVDPAIERLGWARRYRRPRGWAPVQRRSDRSSP